MRVKNLTPHPVVFMIAGETVTVPPEGTVPRVEMEETGTGEVVLVGGLPVSVPVFETRAGRIVDLPEPEDGVALLVSRVVAEAAPHRHDLYIPHDAVRDEQGRIVGCRALARLGTT